MVKQHQIKLAAVHVISVVLVDAGLLALFKTDVHMAVG
jgi:hypothetical protein